MKTHRDDSRQPVDAAAARRRPLQPRRGSIIVFAVGFLAVMAVLAVSYVTVVRTDRRSANAYEQDSRLRPVDAVREHIRDLLAADLFGAKVTTSGTPRTITVGSDPVAVWPSAFEDGEYFDYPFVDQPDPDGAFFSFLEEDRMPTDDDPHPAPNDEAKLFPDPQNPPDERRTAFPDDSWLASHQPINTDDMSGGDEWDTWPAITNLLSAYRWSAREQAWVRDAGAYADLGQFFIQGLEPQSGSQYRGNPDARLWAEENGEDFFEDPTAADNLLGDINGPALAVNQRIYALQLNELQEEFYPPPDLPSSPPTDEVWPLEPADWRFWADTDGDGRPDARWQEIPGLADDPAMRWLIAARIIDNSAMANTNAHLTAGDDVDERTKGDGLTPADVDLLRLLREAAEGATAHPDVRDNGRFDAATIKEPELGAYARHLGVDLDIPTDDAPDTGLRFGALVKRLAAIEEAFEMDADDETDLPLTSLIPGWDPAKLTLGGSMQNDDAGEPGEAPLEVRRWERSAMWRFFGSSPLTPDPRASGAVPYPLEDEIDLRAFHGFNDPSRLSAIESVVDGLRQNNGDPSFLPRDGGEDLRYPNRDSLGPMRSKEPSSRGRSPRTFERLAPEPGGFPDTALGPGDNYDQEDKLERIRLDPRRLLTTISGSGSIGPIPVLNKINIDEMDNEAEVAQFSQQFAVEKVRPNLIADEPSEDEFSGRPTPGRADTVRQAFDAAVWTLAPLATDKPLAAPLTESDIGLIGAAGSAFHYGGGTDSPAKALESTFAVMEGELGAAYALWRAGALAVNLADALDDEDPDVGGATREKPTVARFLPTPLPDNNNFTSTELITLDSRFPHGDIEEDNNNTLMPDRFLGEADKGVTFAGLDRQPFFREVFSLAVYTDTPQDAGGETFPNQDHFIIADANSPDEQLGSIIAVELGNPWAEVIHVSDYEVVIPMSEVSGISDMRFQLDGDIAPGERTVFWFRWPAPDENGQFDDLFDAWLDTVDAPTDEMLGSSSPSPVMFDPVGGVTKTEDLPVLLEYVNAPGAVDPVLVDRISPPAGERFPLALQGDVDFNVDDPDIGPNPQGADATGRVILTQTITRAVEPPAAGGGFPRYVVEWADPNIEVNSANPLEPNAADAIQGWWADFDLTTPADLPITDLPVDTHELGEDSKQGDAKWGSAVGDDVNFQLFVPNGPLLHNSELHMLSAFAHMYVHDNNDATFPDPTSILELDMYGESGSSRWLTVSEQLGMAAHFFYDGQSGSTNPYLGVLDPSRFIIDSGGQGTGMDTVTNLPDTMAVPLATRIFDAFEVMPGEARESRTGGDDTPANGRININTAPRDVLKLLPFVDPQVDIQGWMSSFGGQRLDDLEVYRTRNEKFAGAGAVNPAQVDLALSDVAQPEMLTGGSSGLPGLRKPGAGSDWTPGFATTGELAVLGEWTGDGAIGNLFPSFLELGQDDAASDGAPLELRADNYADWNGDGSLPDPFYADVFNPDDDPEERLAIFRAISNIVSTRSDVFTAWFIVRGYRPSDIEAITFDDSLDDEERASLMNPGNPLALEGVDGDHPGLFPAFEQRWLAVFDRSNVRSPTDRPRVLLMVQLPLK